MIEETTNDSTPEAIVAHKNEGGITVVARLPYHISGEFQLNNDKMITHLKDSNVECVQELSEDNQVQSHNQSQSQCIISNSVAVDRALELFSEALMSDSDTECSDLNISVSQDDKDNDTLSERKLVMLTERRVHFADELVVDTECADDIHHPHVQSNVCVSMYML